MSNREKVIVLVMVVVVLYGIYSFFFASSPKVASGNPKKQLDEINKFVMDVANALKDDFSEQQLYVLSQAKTEWRGDPFLITKQPQKTVVEEKNTQNVSISTPKEHFVYSGFLQMGGRRLAIINGVEYELGNEVEKGEKIVKEIDPLRVVIGPPYNNNNNIVLLLDETK